MLKVRRKLHFILASLWKFMKHQINGKRRFITSYHKDKKSTESWLEKSHQWVIKCFYLKNKHRIKVFNIFLPDPKTLHHSWGLKEPDATKLSYSWLAPNDFLDVQKIHLSFYLYCAATKRENAEQPSFHLLFKKS